MLLFFILPIILFANPITNVRAMQEGKKIVVLYDLSEDTYISQILIEVDGKSRVIPNKFLKGVGHNDDELYDKKKNRKNELSGCCVQILLVSSKDIM